MVGRSVTAHLAIMPNPLHSGGGGETRTHREREEKDGSAFVSYTYTQGLQFNIDAWPAKIVAKTTKFIRDLFP